MKLNKTNPNKTRPGYFLNTGSHPFKGKTGKKILGFCCLFLLFIAHLPVSSQTLTMVSSSCGSRAPWGESQGLWIDASGNTTVYNENIRTGAVDSATIVLTPAQMQAIVDTAVAAGFFYLNSLYDSGALDGTGITLAIVTTSASKEVEVRNICVNSMNRVAKTINLQIIATGIQLKYNYRDSVCP